MAVGGCGCGQVAVRAGVGVWLWECDWAAGGFGGSGTVYAHTLIRAHLCTCVSVSVSVCVCVCVCGQPHHVIEEGLHGSVGQLSYWGHTLPRPPLRRVSCRRPPTDEPSPRPGPLCWRRL